VVATTGGCGTLLNPWFEQLNIKNKIYTCFDTDDDGQGQAAAYDIWATRLGVNRVYNIKLPEKYDVNDYFKDHTKEDFDILYREAKRFTVSGIMSVSDALHEMYRRSLNPEYNSKFALPWKDVNAMIGGGLGRQRLTVIGGAAGMGKTTLSIQIAYHIAMKYKKPSLIFCLEMPEVTLVSKLIQLHYDLVLEEIDYSDALLYSMEIGDIPIYFGYSSTVTPEIFYNTMVEVRNRYGVELGVFDNLQRMIRTGEESDMGSASGLFKDISMDLNIPFLLLSQPRKKVGEGSPTYEDLKGSSAIPADADEVILLHRQRIKDETGHKSFEPRTQIIVDKSRFASGGRTFLYYDGAKAKFHDWTKEYEEECR
jgi:replicative DNA helicase